MISENTYRTDWKRLIRLHTPHFMRMPKWLSFMGILFKPIADVHRWFLSFRLVKNYQLMITPQKCYLERLLNDRFDFSQRRIYIDDGIDRPPTYIFMNVELKPKYLYRSTEQSPVYIYTSGESGDLRDDFIIYVPSSLVFDEIEMSSLTRVYKLAGTKFKIQRY